MARKYNSLFIGADKLNLEGRALKHPALIKLFATLNMNKISETPIKLIGLDLETNHKTAELKLLGFYHDKYYAYDFVKSKDKWLSILFNWVKLAFNNELSIAYWNRLDPFILYKLFLPTMTEEEIKLSMTKFGKVAGEWDRELNKWVIEPITKVKIGKYTFGIQNVIRSSILFYFQREGQRPMTVWAYDIAQLYQNGLEKEATEKLNYYSKIDESAHLVDWDKYLTDIKYKRDIVLKSNELDAKAVKDLGMIIQEQFKDTFGFYPKTIISQGSLARSAIVALLFKIHKGNKTKITDDVKSIGILSFIDKWKDQYGDKFTIDLLSMCFEAYSGGQIEAYAYGYSKEGYIADITSAYPAEIQGLWDLRNSNITTGIGTPPNIKNSYCLIRGDINIPNHVDYHPLTIKHPLSKETNIRPVGEFRASYTKEERDYLVSLGATFNNETWYNIETKGKLSPLALVSKQLTDLRELLRPTKQDYTAKITAASQYGILFEAVDTYIEKEVLKIDEWKEDNNSYIKHLQPYLKNINISNIRKQLNIDIYKRWNKTSSSNKVDVVKQELETFGIYLNSNTEADIINEINQMYLNRKKETVRKERLVKEVFRDGYRGGEFLNPLYATIITSRTRLKISKTLNNIKSNGGIPILAMTDSVVWQGTADMMNDDEYRDPKVVGYYEKPIKIYDIVSLGSGRYGYRTEKGTLTSKKRGLNVVELHNPTGIEIDSFNWLEALKIAKITNKDKINVSVRALVSVGLILNNHSYNWDKLGLIKDETREVDLIVGKQKRNYSDDIKNPSILATQLIETTPISIKTGMLGKYEIIDQSLPLLRNAIINKKWVTTKEQRLKTNGKAVKKYHRKNKDKIAEHRKANYNQLRRYGYTSAEATKMQSWSIDKIQVQLINDNKI